MPGIRRGFDLLAPHYRWMERVLAGRLLQSCRTMYVSDIANSRKILLLGEGPGRFLGEVIRSCPFAQITCVDSSARMLMKARRLDNARVTFVQADILEHEFAAASYDVVATHFFLDCFTPEQLRRLVAHISAVVTPGGTWLLADFRLPPSGPQRWRAAIILKVMYLFFRAAAQLPARHLTNPDPSLQQNGLTLIKRHTANWGLIHTDLWRKSA